jgi:hypothetical protein
MRKKLTLTLATVLVICALTSTTSAQTRVPGVSVGDSFRYTYTLDMNVNGTLITMPELFQQLVDQAKSIEWVQLTVTSVSGTSVSAETLMHFKNGTEQTSTATTDVAIGDGDLGFFLIASNLGPNDQIRQGTNEIINETVTRNFGDNSRQLNHEIITMDYNVTQEELTGFNIAGPLQQSNTESIYWDKQSGALTDMSYHMVTQSEQVNADITLSITLIQSSVFTVPEFPIIGLIVVALAIPTLALMATKKKRISPF